MLGKCKVAIVGVAHMHVLYLARDCLDNPNVDLVGFADTPPVIEELSSAPPFTRKWNIEYVSKRLGARFFTCYKEMLDTEKPDLVLVCTETPLHFEVLKECAQRGIDVSVEKPMATNLSDGLKMARVAEKTKTALMVNWPLAWQPFMSVYKKIIDDGLIGKILKVHQSIGHPGPLGRGVRHPRVEETSNDTTSEEKAGTWWYSKRAGGGAMLDFCCYGAMSCNWLIGQSAVAAMGMRANTDSFFGDCDDNAAMIVRYPSCMAVLEGSWTTPSDTMPPGPELYGSEGKVWSEKDKDEKITVKVIDYMGKLTEIPEPAPEPHMLNISAAYVHHRQTGQPLPEFLKLDQNLQVLAILDAGLKSAESNKLEPVNSSVWEIG